jgi:hypothetical protein
MTKLSIAILAASMLAPTRARAQESPDSLTRSEARCEKTTGSALAGYAARGMACLANCLEHAPDDPSRLCGPYTFDARTAACLDEARAKSEIPLLRDCAGEACPECYYGAACRKFHDVQLSEIQSELGYSMPFLYCDDSASQNGLSSAESSCRRALVKAIDRYSAAVGKCSGRCHEEARSGRIPDEEACRATNLDSPAFDPATQRCIDGARRRFAVACASKCTDAPDCLPVTCEGVLGYLEAELAAFEPTAFCTDRPICGDGFISGVEECDSGRFPNGCAAGEFCTATCTCEPFPVCGDGQVTGFEACDPSASPTGCGAGQVCRFCNYCAYPFCGDGYLDPGEACDPYTYPSGCPTGETCTSSCGCTPVPDPCASATPIPASGGVIGGSTSGPSATSSVCGGAGPEVVFTWTPTSSGVATISTCGNTALDTVVYVRAGTCQSNVDLVCNDQWCGNASRVSTFVTAGTTYHIFVDSYFFGELGGPFTLTVTPPVASPSGAFVDDPGQ